MNERYAIALCFGGRVDLDRNQIVVEFMERYCIGYGAGHLSSGKACFELFGCKTEGGKLVACNLSLLV